MIRSWYVCDLFRVFAGCSLYFMRFFHLVSWCSRHFTKYSRDFHNAPWLRMPWKFHLILDPQIEGSAQGKVTHFVSWCWAYTLDNVVTAVDRWLQKSEADPADVFLWICFFCNNQYRIMQEAGTPFFFPKDGSKGASKKGMSQTCMSNTCMSWLTSWVSTFGIVCDVVVEHFYVLVNILTATSGHCVWCCCRCTPCIRCPSHLHVSHLHALFNNQSPLHVTLHVSLTCVTYMSAYTCLPDMSFFVHVLTMSTHTSPSCMSLLHVSLNLCLLHVLVHVSPTCLSYKSPWHVSLTCLSRMFLLYVSLIHVSLKHFK